MKPLPTAPLTSEDWAIWTARPQRTPDMGWCMIECHKADRRDAALMSWLSLFGHRHYARMPKMPQSAQLPVAHLWLRIDSEWPAGHYMIDLT